MDRTFDIMPREMRRDDVRTLVLRLERRERGALSRLLTLAASGRESSTLAAALERLPKTSAPVVALTGGGGVGKSSLLGAVTHWFAQRGERIGVLACDPESSLTGGALLGDRCRIAGLSSSDRIFIRSLAVPPGQQGIAANIGVMIDVMRTFGFDRIFVESVGAGQGDVAIRGVADVVVLVLQPQTGDELQWEKAGILEIADVVVVNKSDLPGADQTVADLAQQLRTPEGKCAPILKTSITVGEGIDDLCRTIELAPG